MANTRWRDFADVYLLSRRHPQAGGELVDAIRRVAGHRQVMLSPLTSSLAGYPALAQSRWAAWRRRQSLDEFLPEDFAEVLDAVATFADPCLDEVAQPRTWDPAVGRWVPDSSQRSER